MRLEDVKPGMWIRHVLHDSVMRVGPKSETHDAWAAWGLDGSSLFLNAQFVDQLEPWVPRVGDWVLRYGTRQVVTSVESFGFEVVSEHGARDFVHTGMHVGEPCMRPTSPTPMLDAVREDALRRARAFAAASAEALGVRVAAEVERQSKPGADRYSLWADRPAAEAANAADEAKRDHNAVCVRCGGRAYQGLKPCFPECVEPFCDDPNTRMPHTLIETMRRGEPVWTAKGHGAEVQHPTEEGAVLAWREAVRG